SKGLTLPYPICHPERSEALAERSRRILSSPGAPRLAAFAGRGNSTRKRSQTSSVGAEDDSPARQCRVAAIFKTTRLSGAIFRAGECATTVLQHLDARGSGL